MMRLNICKGFGSNFCKRKILLFIYYKFILFLIDIKCPTKNSKL